jgi:hypothetical protein
MYKNPMKEWKKFLKEGADWGGFGGSKKVAPLDTYEDPRDSKPMSYEDQLKVFEMMVERGDRDPHEVLNYPEHFQNDLDFPDLQDDDVEDILSKLGLPEMNDPKWQRHTIGQKAVRESSHDVDDQETTGLNEGFFKKKKAPKRTTTADQLEKAVDIMTRPSEGFQEENGLSYVIWGMNDDPFDRELFQLGKQFVAKLKAVAHQYRSKEDSKLTAQEDSLTEEFAATAAEEAAKVNRDLGDDPSSPGALRQDQEYWDEYGITTGEELAVMLISDTYSDMYKAIHRRRPSMSTFRTAEQAQDALDALDRDYEDMMAQEEMDVKAQEEYQLAADQLAALMPDEYEAQYNKMPKQSGMGRGMSEARDWQKDSDRITDHEDNKTRVLDKGGNKHQEPGWEEKRPKKRGKSSPPAAKALEELIYNTINDRFGKNIKEK